MGEQRVQLLNEDTQMRHFVRQLLRDVQTLEAMIRDNWFETDIVRIGAEQEMCLVDRNFKPSPLAMEILAKLTAYPWVETELARFNLECNLDPRKFEGTCFSDMEKEVKGYLEIIRKHAAELDTDVMLTGILPTIRKFDLGMHNLTPKERYKALMDAITAMRPDGMFELKLRGVDELLVSHDSPLIEACNTSFQVHLQVSPHDFVQYYNIAQVLAGPVMGVAANSPVLFGKRLWHETRIALFQQALDVRTTHDHMRERSPRVTFGHDWLQNSIVDIYKEDIARFRVLLSSDIEEDSYAMYQEGKVSKLRFLQIHNSTVYRWNRACYGVSDTGKPHLRIENRVLPAGPTTVDEIANACFWAGLMVGMATDVKDVTRVMAFEDARDNFGKAARFGIDTKFTWFKDKKISAVDLIKNELLPLAKAGLMKQKVSAKDADKYLDIIRERVENHMTGARWTLQTFSKLIKETSRDEAVTALTAAMHANQMKGKPVSKWKIPHLDDLKFYRPARLTVEEFMETELFTVHRDDIVELVADMMDWKQIRHMPVEDKDGKLVGLITGRLLLRHFTKMCVQGERSNQDTTVNDIMIANPVTISPDTTIVEALRLLRKHKIGSLPVVNKKHELIGIITEKEFLQISGRLMERYLKEGGYE